QARRDQVTLLVVIDFLSELRDEVGTLRPGPNKVHVPAEDVPELRNLVDANLANDATHTRHAIIAIARPNGSVLLSVNAHRAKLHHRKSASVFADALLLVKHWPVRIDLDQNGCDYHDR